MTSFMVRRARCWIWALAACVALLFAHWRYGTRLADLRFFDGWVLAAAAGLPMLFAVRRWLSVVPLLPASTWMQVHAYAGAVAALMFFVHTGLRMPTGTFDTLVWGVFIAVSISGAVGIVLCRLLPPRLIRRGQRLVYEQIEPLRKSHEDRIEALALDSVTATGSGVIADFYLRRLAPFLMERSRLPFYLFQGERKLHRIMAELDQIERYLNRDGIALLGQIRELTRAKRQLDAQEAMQYLLKSWPLVHAPLSYVLGALVVLHVLAAYSYCMGGL